MRFFVQREAPGRFVVQPSGWDVTWQPIAEAPKDGSWFVVRASYEDGTKRPPIIVQWNEDGFVESFSGAQVNKALDPELTYPAEWSPLVAEHTTGVTIKLPPEEELRAQQWAREIARVLIEYEKKASAPDALSETEKRAAELLSPR